ncbi:MAG: MotA/TolQ/ExbB proton channel family protein [Alphaproteobacteria bacterium]|nr:MotA/TolQ/ExbB proton channel family protein [Alphaproteobacteria bacterium]MCB9695026.1 MotA/TolQ/ExbB proton channel family protein [Alphaproteobacteria bacterium]
MKGLIVALALGVCSTAAAQEGGHASFGPAEFWAAAGTEARAVVIILVSLSLGSTFVWIERMLAFSRARRQSMRVAAEIVGPLQHGDVEGALRIAGDERYKSSYLAAVLRAGLAEMSLHADEFGVSNAKRAVEKAIAEETAKLKRGFAWLATTGSTAPFVGLFGTTFGVINAFSGMAATGGGGLSGISAGIAEALYTTAIGIGVAIYGVWLFNFFNGKVEKVQNELSSSEADFVDWASKHAHGRRHAAK